MLSDPNLFDIDGTARSELISALESIHNHFYANDGLSPEQALEEAVKLLFVKVLDERSDQREFRVSSQEFAEVANTGSCARFESRMKVLVSNAVKEFTDLFDATDTLKIRPTSIAFAVQELSKFNFNDLPGDVKGAAFQTFLSASQRVGRGQFFTPELVVEFCVGIIDPKPGEIVADPACGSGGFLSAAFAHSRRNGGRSGCRPVGIEISRTAARLARMRMLLLGVPEYQIFQADGLSDVRLLGDQLNLDKKKDGNSGCDGFADVIVTNPPFGTQGKIVDQQILQRFDLGHSWEMNDGVFSRKGTMKQQVPELLFIEQCLNLLRKGGRLGIVLPNGEFENSSLQYVREYLLTRVSIDAVVKLPAETFVPSGTGIKTSVLFATKYGESETPIKKVFFAEVTRLGYSGNKSASPLFVRDEHGEFLVNGSQRRVLDEDFTLVLRAFKERTPALLYPQCPTIFESEDTNSFGARLDYEFHHPRYRAQQDGLRKGGAVELGDLVRIAKSRPAVLSQQNEEVEYVELSDVGLEYQEIVNSERLKVHDLPSRAAYQVFQGQILTAVAGNSIGTARHASAFVTKNYDGAICSNGFRVLEVNEDKIPTLYLLYCLSTPVVQEQIFRLRTGAAIPAISESDLKRILIPRRPRDEEEQISQVLESGYKAREAYRQTLKFWREE